MLILDQWWWLILPGLILGLYAEIKVSSTYRKFLQVGSESGLTGAQAAREILDDADLEHVPVAEIGGHLTDHYDPVKKALFLSSENFHGQSLSAIGVAAHEAGHALQQKAAYAPFNFRMTLVPAFQFASHAWAGIIFLGWILGGAFFAKFIGIAIGVFAVITLFQVITLPVEFDASRRAKAQLLKIGLIRNQESAAVAKVLNAAAMTYVAAMVGAVLSLLHLILIARGNDRN
ncbi:MAG: zinc metallopeptidase [Verrucomicrobia bacterium]|nr:zinc metallopeptidase [Verrucomicrobiota bacterium]